MMHDDTHADPALCEECGEIVLPPIPIRKSIWWSQNSRGSWQAKAKRMAMVKREAGWRLRQYRLDQPDTYQRIRNSLPVRVIAVIRPLTTGRFDAENAAPMVKAILDAMTAEGYWPDDNSRYIQGPDFRKVGRSSLTDQYQIEIHIQPLQGGAS